MSYYSTFYSITIYKKNTWYVKGNKEDYIDQLNVYTHIWQNLRNEKLSGTAIIATQFPKSLKRAIDSDDEEKLQREIEDLSNSSAVYEPIEGIIDRNTKEFSALSLVSTVFSGAYFLLKVF